jgi:hypothetical protein
MVGLAEALLKARPDVAILAHLTKITQRHVQWYLIRVADAPEGAADFIAKVQKMANSHILDVVDDYLGEKLIWQQQLQAHRAIKEKGRK